jgi:acyl carrier protein phosphodiesterase
MPMNFLAHLLLAGDDEGLRLGAMLGDFVRGKQELAQYDARVQLGIMLHRHIDSYTDAQSGVRELRSWFHPPFRRYGGIIIDLAFDHELAKRWKGYSETSLEDFDRGVREMLARRNNLLPERLRGFMWYADRRGLFAAYRDDSEIVHSLRGVGRRLSRSNPLHRVDEIWDDFVPVMSACFEPAFEEIQSEVAAWLKSKSTISGS